VFLIYRQRKLKRIKGFPHDGRRHAGPKTVSLGKLENKNGVAGKDFFPTTPKVKLSN